MAGYKNSILQLEPVSFVTFDADNMYNPATGKLESPFIVDESGNNNDIYLQTDSNQLPSYLMGQPSLVQREVNAGQHSITIAPYGATLYNPFTYEKTLLEMFNNTQTDFTYDYTVMMNFNKVHDLELQNKTYNATTGRYDLSSTTKTTRRYLFNKGSTIQAYFEHSLLGTFLVVVYPNSIQQYRIPDITKFFGVTNHFTVTHRRVQRGSGLFYLERRAYINGETIISSDSSLISTVPTANNTAAWYFGGTNDVVDLNTLDDRQTTPLTLDQIALFDKCLSVTQVANLYKKTLEYINLIRNTRPRLHVPFDDRTLTGGLALKLDTPATSVGSQYSAREPNTTRLVKFSNKVDTEVGVRFENANAVIGTTPQTQQLLETTDNSFSLSFWLEFSSTVRGVVFSYQEKVHPFKGLLCEVNMKGLEYNQGMIQFKLGEDVFLHAPEFDSNGNKVNYADGVARHYSIVLKDNLLTLYINGTANGTLGTNFTMPTSSQVIHIMGISPSNLNVLGIISHLTYHNYALEPQIIDVMCWFMVISKIRGRITLDGVPTIADVRVFDNITGSVLTEATSNADGWYDIQLNTSNFVDIMYFMKGNQNTTYRTIGRVLADEYEDVDWF